MHTVYFPITDKHTSVVIQYHVINTQLKLQHSIRQPKEILWSSLPLSLTSGTHNTTQHYTTQHSTTQRPLLRLKRLNTTTRLMEVPILVDCVSWGGSVRFLCVCVPVEVACHRRCISAEELA